MIVCGPVLAQVRVGQPAAAVALVAGDALGRQEAWKRLGLGQCSSPEMPPDREAGVRRLG